MTSGHLDSPPESLVAEDGSPRTGTFVGPLKGVDIDALIQVKKKSRAWRLTHEKRWLYTLITSPQYIVGVAVVHLGYAATSFVTIVDRAIRTRIFDMSCMTSPVLADVRTNNQTTRARLRSARMRVSIHRPGPRGPYILSLHTRHLDLHAVCETTPSPTPITVVSPVPEGIVNVTEKRVLLPTRGGFTLDGVTHTFDEAFSGTDYTQGYLARHTTWRWAMAMGLTTNGVPVGFNLADGFNGGMECALWLGDEVIVTDSTRFQFDRVSPLQPWHVQTTDKLIDLDFRADAMHSEKKNLGLVRSTFVQPLGQFSGKLQNKHGEMFDVVKLPGVVENQHSVW